MPSALRNARFATALAFGGILFAAGIVTAANGDPLILGTTANTSTAQTRLSSNFAGNAFAVAQTSGSVSANGIRGDSNAGSGGVFTSTSNNALFGLAASGNRIGVVAINSGTAGTGAALFADGQNNEGIRAQSAQDTAITGTATGCTGFLCGANGVSGNGAGFAAGVFGNGEDDAIAGVYASDGLAAALYAYQTNDGVPGVWTTAEAGNGLVSFGAGGIDDLDECDFFYCAAGAFFGDNGVMAQTSTAAGWALYGEDVSGTGLALFAAGDAVVTGDLTVTGTCTGCTAGAVGINGSGAALKQGDAVTVVGVRNAADGSIAVVVAAARKGDAVFGVVDRAIDLSPERVTVGGSSRKVAVPGKGNVTVTAPTKERAAQGRKWMDGSTTVAAGKTLRIITSGMFSYAASPTAGVAAGDALAVGSRAGKLEKAGADATAGSRAGKFLGVLDGKVVLLVQPS
jgi:hypothetical protein